MLTLDVEVAHLVKPEQARVEIRPVVHIAEVHIVRQVIDKGQAKTVRVRVCALQQAVFAGQGVAALRSTRYSMEPPMPLIRGPSMAACGMSLMDSAPLARQCLVGLLRIAHAQGKTGATGAMLGGKAGGKTVGLLR